MLGNHYDSNLTWAYHVANVCKKMAYYLFWSAVITRYFFNNIIKMLINSLVFSPFVHGLHVWLFYYVSVYFIVLLNCGIHMTSGLHKYDHVSLYRFIIGWLPVSSVIQCCSLVAIYKEYKSNHWLLLNLQIKFGQQSSYHTRTPASFANIFQHNLTFSKKPFDQRQQTGGIIYQ